VQKKEAGYILLLKSKKRGIKNIKSGTIRLSRGLTLGKSNPLSKSLLLIPWGRNISGNYCETFHYLFHTFNIHVSIFLGNTLHTFLTYSY
jgi:hypothetical protein